MLREAATALQAHSGWAHTAPQTRGPITAEVSLSPFGGWDVQDQGPGRLGVRRGLLPGSQTRSSCGTRGEAGLQGLYKAHSHDCPRGSVGKESACSAGDPGSIPGSGRPPAEGNGNPLQYSCLGKSHGQRSLMGYSLWDRRVDTTLTFTLMTTYLLKTPYPRV